MSDDPKLRECPFCGSDLIEYTTCDPADKYAACYCMSCGVTGMEAYNGYCRAVREETKPVCAKDWNTRPIEDALRAEIESLKVERELHCRERGLNTDEIYETKKKLEKARGALKEIMNLGNGYQGGPWEIARQVLEETKCP